AALLVVEGCQEHGQLPVVLSDGVVGPAPALRAPAVVRARGGHLSPSCKGRGWRRRSHGGRSPPIIRPLAGQEGPRPTPRVAPRPDSIHPGRGSGFRLPPFRRPAGAGPALVRRTQPSEPR